MATDPFLGRVLGRRYVVLEKLGRGGMGAVYRARQQTLGRDVAIKVLNDRLSADPIAHERFRAEARAIAALQHPHVVALHDFDVDGDVMFLVLELMSGNDLRHALSHGRLHPVRALHIVRDIARALVAAHAKNILHRDLKPENVFLVTSAGTDEHAKVIDFGIAKLARAQDGIEPAAATLDAITDGVLTEDGMLPGTPGYVSPERLMGRGVDDPRSDLYALGVTWFEMLAGRRPHQATVPMAEVVDALNKDAPTLASLGFNDVPESHEALLRRLLARDPEARVSSAQDLLREIDRIANFTPTPPSGALLGAAALAAAHPAGTASPAPSSSPTQSTPATPTSAEAVAAARNETAATRAASLASLPAPTRSALPRVAVLVVAAALAVVAVALAVGVGVGARPATIETMRVDRALRDDVAHVVDSLADADLVAAARDAGELHRTMPAEPAPQVIAAVVALVDGDEDRFEALLDDVLAPGGAAATVRDGPLVAWLARFGDDDVPRLATALAADAALRDSFVAKAALAACGVGRAPGAFADIVTAALDGADALRPRTALVPLLRSAQKLGSGDAAGAVEAARAGLAGHPLSVELKLALVRALQAQGKLAEAQRVVDEVYRVESTPAVRLARANLLAARVDHEDRDGDRADAEQQRARLMADLLAPDMARESRARAALAHAEVLASTCGRHGDAEALIQQVIDDARAADDVVTVARATLLSARGAWLLSQGSDELLRQRTEQLRALAAEPALSERALRRLRGDARLFEGLVAVRDGDLPLARRTLEDLRSHADRLAFRAGPHATDELAFAVAGAGGDVAAAQALATSLWPSACERERALAVVVAGTGDLAAARAGFARANDDVAGCRAAGRLAGVVVSLVLQARLALADGDAATARDRLFVLAQTLPRLDPTLALAAEAARLRAQLDADGSPPALPTPAPAVVPVAASGRGERR